MAGELLSVFLSEDLPRAELLRQRLADEGVDAVVERTASPLDGLTAANQGTHVMVRQEDAVRAREVVEAFLAEESR